MYSDLYLRPTTERQVPRWVLVPTLLLIVGFSFYFFSLKTSTSTQASALKISEKVQSQTDTSSSLFFSLPESHSVYVLYGTTPDTLTLTTYDVRDVVGSPSPHKYFYIEFTGLKPMTQYYYHLIADDKIIQTGVEGNTNTFTTLAKRTAGTVSKPVYGKLISTQGTGVPGALVQVTSSPNVLGRMVMGVTKSSGEWLINIPWATVDEDTIQIRLLSDQLPSSTITAVLSRAAPLPQSVITGTDYTFISNHDNVLPANTTRSAQQDYILSLQFPIANAVIPIGKPLIKGKGVPGTKVTVLLDSSPPIRLESIVRKDGIWVTESETNFTAGRYTLVAFLQDNNGVERSIERSFVIAKSGEQVLGESTTTISTPSGTLTPRVSSVPSPIPSRVVTTSQQPTPSIIAVKDTPPGGMPIWVVLFGSVCLLGGYIAIRGSRYTH
ncbi:MAG: hypothetical protein WCO78_00720 [Candidatus Roizmanbacteria bacterium]